MVVNFEQLQNDISTIKEMVLMLTARLNQHEKQDSQPHPTSYNDIVGIEEAAKEINYKVNTIYRLVSEKKIPFIKKTGHSKLYFSRKALQEWLMEGRQRTLSDQKKDVNLDLMRRGGRRKAA